MTKTNRTIALLLSLVLLIGVTPMLGFANLTDDDLIAGEEIVEEFAEVAEQAEAVAADVAQVETIEALEEEVEDGEDAAGETAALIEDDDDAPALQEDLDVSDRDPYGGYVLSAAEKSVIATQSVKKKVNTVITTDGEVDDMASFIRLLHYINEFNVKGIILSASRWHYSGGTVMNPDGTINATRAQYRWCGLRWPLMYLEKYEAIYENLLVHQPDMPTPDFLRSIFKIGNIKQQGEMVEDTEGSDWIKKCILENPDGEQLVVNIWGGANTLCRALKSLEDEFKGTDKWDALYNKINTEVSAYFITDQDQSTPGSLTSYIRPNWPLMRVFYNNSLYNAVGYSFNANAPYFQTGWTNTILKVGSPLGSEYLVNGGGWDLRPAAIQQPTHSYYTPPVPTFHNYLGDNYPYSTWGESENRGGNTTNVGRFMSEGDNPAFWFIQDVGLRGGIENPTWGGWGGRFKRDTARANNEWTDASSYVSETMTVGVSGVTGDNAARVSLSRWLTDMQNDFSARVQWGLTDKYEDANHNPLCGVMNGLDIDAAAGQTLNLKGVAYDPDGDELSYRWWRYTEADTYGGTGTNQGGTQTLGTDKNFTYTVPANAAPGQTIHLIFEVSDAPSNTDAYGYMKAYKRVVITVRDQFGGYVLSEAEKEVIATQSVKKKVNTVITTDGEVDDMASFIRLLHYINEFNVKGIILSASRWHYSGGTVMNPDGTINATRAQYRWCGLRWPLMYLEKYEAIYENLLVHQPDMPTPDSLRSMFKIGNIKQQGEMVEDTEGSDWIKKCILENPDGEELVVNIWGGANTLCRALKSIEDEFKGTAEWTAIYDKINKEVSAYFITDQDQSTPGSLTSYIRPNWPLMRVFYNNSLYNAVGYSFNANASYFQTGWTNTILKVGSPLGSEYLVNGGGWDLRNAAIQRPTHTYYTDPVPTFHNYFGDNYPYSTWGESENRGGNTTNVGRFMSEGDNPAFWFIQDVGLRGGIENPTWGGWGGRFKRDTARTNNEWTDASSYVSETMTVGVSGVTGDNAARVSLSRWLPDMQSDFTARVQWGLTDKYADANHNPLCGVMNGLDIVAAAGQTLNLKGAAYDPDGDELSYRWWRYTEADTYGGTGTNQGGTQTLGTDKDFTYTVPANAAAGQTIHLIFEVSDAPSNPGAYGYMKAYKRVVITVRDPYGGYVLSNDEKQVIATQSVKKKVNTVITTDGEVDDMASFIRLLHYINEFNVKGIILSASRWHYSGGTVMNPDGSINATRAQYRWCGLRWPLMYLEKYEAIYENLLVHQPDMPTPDYLRSIFKIGNIKQQGEMVEDTEGSNWIKKCILENPDGEQLVVNIWGGANTLCRALKSLEDEFKGTDKWDALYNKINTEVSAYFITDQDQSTPGSLTSYIRPNWPLMRVFYNNNTYSAVGYAFTVTSYFEPEWTNTILKVGSPLGSEYLVNGGGWDLRPAAIQQPTHSYYTDPVPTFHNYFGDNYPYSTWGESENRGGNTTNVGRFMSEGDNPAFWFIQDVGLRGGIDHPEWGGWGGRFFRDPNRTNNEYTDSATYISETIIPGMAGTTGRFSLQRWLPDMQSDFTNRVQWGITEKYEDANHNPMSGVMNGLDLEAKAGVTIDLKGAAYDPDGDELSYRWYRYAEVDTYGGNPNTNQGKGTYQLATTKEFTYTVPEDALPGQTIHLIFEVSDAPSNPGPYAYMVAYKHVVITVVADPSVSADKLEIPAGLAGTLEVSLGNGTLSAAHAVISSSNTTVAAIDRTALAASGTVTVNAIRSGAADITVTFWFTDGTSKVVTIPVEVTSTGGKGNAGVRGENDKLLGLPVEFSLWLDAIDITSINNLRMVFSVSDNAAFSGYTVSGSLTNFQPLPLQGAVGGILWEKLDDLWRGTLWLGLPSGGVNLNVLLDIVKFSFDVGLPGDVTLRLESMVIGSFEGEYLKMVTAGISNETGTFTTEVVRKYDLDRNGFVGQEDITLALRAVGWTKDDIGWNDFVIARIQRDNRPDLIITPAMCDVNSSGEVDMGDILDILRNLS